MGATKEKKVHAKKGGHGRRVVGMIGVGGEWRYVVQDIVTESEQQPILCGLYTLEELGGSLRKKAERWGNYFRRGETRVVEAAR